MLGNKQHNNFWGVLRDTLFFIEKEMKRIYLTWLLSLATTFVFAQSDSLTLLQGNWQIDTIENGLIFKRIHFVNQEYFASNQNITILEILPEANAKLAFVSAHGRKLTSAMAAENNAIAAINGTYFDMKNGRTICFMRINGKNISTNVPQKSDPVHRKYYQYGTLVLQEGKPVILKADSLRTWENTLPYTDIMTAGPLLLKDGKEETYRHDRTFVTNRHNRTAIGIKADSTVLFFTVDGRMEESAGMTLDELCATMKWLGCQDVINMDGGGSTTFYLHSNQSDTAIVNYPTDNGKFDHQGERRVANAILLLRK